MVARIAPIAPPARQRGAMLLEALMGILIFSLGVLAMVALQALSINNQADAKYRADASYLAVQIAGLMWTDRANLANYQHRPTGGGTSCDPTGADSPSATVAGSNMKGWLDNVSAALPGAVSQRQQILFLVAAGNEVTITICWKAPQETIWHNYRLVTHIN